MITESILQYLVYSFSASTKSFGLKSFRALSPLSELINNESVISSINTFVISLGCNQDCSHLFDWFLGKYSTCIPDVDDFLNSTSDRMMS